MSARGDLYMELMWDNTPEGEARANALIDAFAHELAEKQRAWLRSQEYELDCICDACSACLAREYIDLIDPEVRSDG